MCKGVEMHRRESISAIVNKHLASTSKHSFAVQKIALPVVIFLLSVILVLIIWNGWEKNLEYRGAQMKSMQESSWAAANEVTNYVKLMQSNISMFAEKESTLLRGAIWDKSIETSGFALLKHKVKAHYPDAIKFLIWDEGGKLIIDSDGMQIDKPEVYKLPSISKLKDEYAVRMHHHSDYKHFNIIAPWKLGGVMLGIFGLSFPSELIQPLLTNHQNIDYQLVLWRQDSPGFVEFLSADSGIELIHDVYLEEKDMQRVGAVATITGTQWDVVSLYRPDLFSNKLKQIILSSLYKFLAILAAILAAFFLYRNELQRRYTASEKIRKNEERLQLALESTQDGVWEIDFLTGEYFFNDRWCQMLGYKNSELKSASNTCAPLIHADDLKETKRVFNAHLDGDLEFYEREHRIKHKSGKWLWVHDRGRVLEWQEDGSPQRAIGTTADITKRKQAETTLRRNEEALHSFYAIVSVEDAALHNQIQCLLASGCQYLRMKCGIFSYVEGDRYTVMQVHTTSPEYKIQAGDKFDLSITYCQFTLEQRMPVGFAYAKNSKVAKHPAYEILQLEAYLGVPVFLDGSPYGTLNFTSIEPREEEFSDSEKHFVQLMAEWISNKLQSQFEEQRHKEASQTLALHLENTPTATIEWTADGKIKRWSSQAEGILGWQEQDVIGKAPSEWLTINPHQKNALIKLQAYIQGASGDSPQFSLELQDSTGTMRTTEWVLTRMDNIPNRAAFYIALVRDVTERIQVQQELMRSKARLNDLFDNAPDMYFSIDASGKIQSVNQFCAEYLGYSKEELLNKPYWNLIHQNDIRRTRRHINVVFEDQVNEFEMEVRILNKQGDILNTHQRLRLIKAHQGIARELRVLCRDITQRATSQQERLDHIKVQRDELGREMRHRIKNNLQAIVGLLKVNLDAYPELSNVLVTSINQVDTIAIVNNLMIDSEHQLVNLVELVKQVTQASTKLFSQEVSFEVLCEDAEYCELWEEETVAVSLIISELITNAMKHRAKTVSDSDGVRVKIKDDSSGLVVEIANAVEYVDNQMFDLEEKSKAGGVGLGMVQSLMPPEGAELDIYQHEQYVVAKLTLKPPVLLNLRTSQMNVLEAIS